MVTIHIEPLARAVADSSQTRLQIAVHADVSPDTLSKVLKANDDTLSLSTIAKVASYMGLDIEVRFKKAAPVAEAA
jgi:DNA-binding phage protein